MLKKILRSTLLRSSAVYTVSSVINAAIPFLLMPVLTRHLTPTDYGVVSLLNVLLGITAPFIGLNVHGAVSIRYFDRSNPDLPRYIGNCLLLLLVSTVTVSLFFWIAASTINTITLFPSAWLGSVIAIAVGQFVILILMTLWQAQEKPYAYGAFQIIQTLSNIGMTIAFVVILGMNWQGRIWAHVITTIIFAFAALLILWHDKRIRFSYNRDDLRHAMKFGIPLIPHALGWILITQTDRILIANMVSLEDMGVYSVGFQVAMIVLLVASSFNNAFVPWLYRRLGEGTVTAKLEIVRLTYLYFGAILLFSLFLSAVAPWFLSFFVGKNFLNAYKYVVWIAVGFSFTGMYYMVANYIFYAGATHILAMITFFTATVNIALCYLFIKINGAVGAAQASTIALFMSFILTWLLSARVYPMPWRLRVNQACYK